MPEFKPRISVVICTYNRAELLNECLTSLTRQSADLKSFEVIIIDNNSNDATPDICKPFLHKHSNFRYVREPQPGLSHARNRGYREAITDWICYLDDDAKAFENYVERILYVTENHDFDCFGGIFLPWYKYGKPDWYKDEYGSNPIRRASIGFLETGYAYGGVMVIRKHALELLGGFSTNIGMSGTTVSYGEEILLQTRMRKRGMSIGFDPELRVYHLVNRYKLRTSWFIRSAYANGRDDWETFDREINWLAVAKLPPAAILRLLRGCLKFTPMLSRKDYYIQNWAIDVMSPLARDSGKFLSGLKLMAKWNDKNISPH